MGSGVESPRDPRAKGFTYPDVGPRRGEACWIDGLKVLKSTVFLIWVAVLAVSMRVWAALPGCQDAGNGCGRMADVR